MIETNVNALVTFDCFLEPQLHLPNDQWPSCLVVCPTEPVLPQTVYDDLLTSLRATNLFAVGSWELTHPDEKAEMVKLREGHPKIWWRFQIRQNRRLVAAFRHFWYLLAVMESNELGPDVEMAIGDFAKHAELNRGESMLRIFVYCHQGLERPDSPAECGKVFGPNIEQSAGAGLEMLNPIVAEMVTRSGGWLINGATELQRWAPDWVAHWRRCCLPLDR